MDVGPLVIPHAEAPKLIRPRKGTLDDPAPPIEPAAVSAVRRIASQGHDMPRPETAPNVAATSNPTAIAKRAVRPRSFSPTKAVQRAHPIHQRQRFFRVVPVRAGQTNRRETSARPSQIR